MKKGLLSIMAIMLCVVAFGQNMQEVLYLKNGSIIRGAIVEEKYGESVKIQTADGSVFVYKMDEIEKKTKEAPIVQNAGNSSYGQVVMEKKKGPTRGYRAFINFGLGAGVGDYGDNKIEISTVHGYQINPKWFVGLGVGDYYYVDNDLEVIPIFAEGRYEFKEGRFSPFVSMRLGAAIVLDGGGTNFYYSPSFGLRVANRLNLSVAYDATSIDMCDEYYYDEYYYMEETIDCGALMFRIGIDLGAR